MQVQLKKPELERFIDEQVQAGHFASPEAAVAAAVEQMMLDRLYEWDEETVAAIDRAEEQIERGQYRDWEQVKAELRAKYPAK